jgi:hypothetical protein
LLKETGYSVVFSSLTFSSLPVLEKVQPWKGQVKLPLLPCLRRHSMAPLWAQALMMACSSPFLSRVMTTGWRPIQVV